MSANSISQFFIYFMFFASMLKWPFKYKVNARKISILYYKKQKAYLNFYKPRENRQTSKNRSQPFKIVENSRKTLKITNKFKRKRKNVYEKAKNAVFPLAYSGLQNSVSKNISKMDERECS